MLQSKQIWKTNSLSHLYYQARQGFQMRNVSRYWFSGVLSASDDLVLDNFTQDLERGQKYSLLSILNTAFADIIGFTHKQPSDSIFKLLEIMKQILKVRNRKEAKEQPGLSYRMWMYQLHFFNSLGLFSMKNKQYNYALSCFQQITDIYQNGYIDPINQIFLVSINNFIICLETIRRSHKIKQLQNKIIQVYEGLVNKYLGNGCNDHNLLLLLTVYKQQEQILKKLYKEKNSLLIRKHLQVREVKENPATDLILFQQMLRKNKVNKYSQLIIRKCQFDFFTITHETVAKVSQLRKKKQQQKVKAQMPQDRLLNIQKILQTHFVTIQTPSRVITPREQIRQTPQHAKSSILLGKQMIIDEKQALSFKINNIIIDVSQDGVVISDFLKEYKHFLGWSALKGVMKRFKYTNIFTQLLPVQNYYDIARVLSNYLRYETIERRKIVFLNEYPNQLLLLNMHTKIFWKQAAFIYICLMNAFDPSIVDEVIECYVHDFLYFFKRVGTDQFIQVLSNKFLQVPQNKENNKVYNLQTKKRSKDTIREELETQLNLPLFKRVVKDDMKKSAFKLMLLLKKSKKIYLTFLKSDEFYMHFSIQEITESETNLCRVLKVPLYVLKRYFPYDHVNPQKWLITYYGKYIVQGYHHCFDDYPHSFINRNYFSIKVFAKKIQIIPHGRYKTQVIALLVGSMMRVWGIVIKIFEMVQINQNVTFIYNPYCQFMCKALCMNGQETKDILQGNLLNRSVRDTYGLLKKFNKLGTTMKVTEYWNLLS